MHTCGNIIMRKNYLKHLRLTYTANLSLTLWHTYNSTLMFSLFVSDQYRQNSNLPIPLIGEKQNASHTCPPIRQNSSHLVRKLETFPTPRHQKNIIAILVDTQTNKFNNFSKTLFSLAQSQKYFSSFVKEKRFNLSHQKFYPSVTNQQISFMKLEFFEKSFSEVFSVVELKK